MSFKDGENNGLTSDNMEQEEKISIDDTSINLGYVKIELENEEPEFEETQHRTASNFENVSQETSEQRNNGDSIKEENKDLIQETIEQSICIELEIIQCHRCKVLFEEWEYLEDHMLHCPDEMSNRLYDNTLDAQRKPADEIEETQRNGGISTAIDDNRSSLTPTETIDSQACKERSFSEKKHKCSECSYKSNHKLRLESHILNQHSNTSKKDIKLLFVCDICQKRFTRKDILKRHMMNIHSNTNEKKYKCTECSHQTNRKDNLEKHLNLHNIKPSENICKKKFTSKGNLKIPIEDKLSNTNEKTYKCSKCPYQTDHKGNFKAHLNTHNEINLFECDVCKRKFTLKRSLKEHIMNIHLNSSEKKYKCTECSFRTHHKSHFNTHLNKHIKIKPFECDVCKMRFTQKGNLKKHIRNQHSNINEKEYKCTKCSYQTNVKDKLSKHINIHIKPFECDICKKKFTMMANLKVHIRNQHSKENKYKCTQCSYQTNRKDYIEPHLNRHYNIKPFECHICKTRFTQKCNLKMHIADKHLNINEKK